jgi:hypothetical protein
MALSVTGCRFKVAGWEVEGAATGVGIRLWFNESTVMGLRFVVSI